MSNFWTSLDFHLINCKIELDLTCSNCCLISESLRKNAVAANPNPNPPVQVVEAAETISAKFQMTTAKLYISQSLCLEMRTLN